jgi:hypothetical protein
MNLLYERTIAIYLPIYFEREETERERKKSVHLENIYLSPWQFMQEFDLIVIEMSLDAGSSYSITKQCAHLYTVVLSEMVARAPFR